MKNKMDKDWIKAVTLLCNIAGYNTESMDRVLRYLKIMSAEYGLDEEKFQKIYETWNRTGKIPGEYMRRIYEKKIFLYYCGLDGMCRMLKEGLIDEELFLELLCDLPHKTIKEKEGYIEFYPELPGCIAFADSKENLKKEMQRVLYKYQYYLINSADPDDWDGGF